MFDLIHGPQRDLLMGDAAERFLNAGCLVVDQRRSRPFWFDGRFLAARDLNREQSYFLTRQADLGEAAGMGVADGLLVSAGDSATRVRIAPGHGVCAGGARVVVAPVPATAGTQGDLVVDLADLPVQAQLNARIGIGGRAAIPDSVRSGLFVLALRPIEFTANPVGRYPSQPGEVVSATDGEVIEATLITLIPFAEHDAHSDEHQRRSAAAQRVFLAGGWRAPANCLPLALLRVDRNQVQWIDPWMMRRRLGASRSDPLGLGGTSRPDREAFLVQYQRQLEALLTERAGRLQPLRFAASEHFVALPPAGPLPAACVSADGDQLVQYFFPPEMDVDLAVVPEDELATVLEESFLLPPIALDAAADELAASAVLVLIPVPRAQLRSMPTTPVAISRPGLTGSIADRLGASPATLLGRLDFAANRRLLGTLSPLRPGLGTIRDSTPLPVVGDLTPTVPAGTTATADTTAFDAARWRALLPSAGTLWYLRRRNVSYQDSRSGLSREIFPDEATREEALRAKLRDWSLLETLQETEGKATTAAKNDLIQGLINSGAGTEELIARSVLNGLKTQPRIDQAVVAKAIAAVADPELPRLLKQVEDAVLEPEVEADGTPIKAAVDFNRAAREKLSDPATVTQLAAIVRGNDAASFDTFAAELKETLRTKPAAAVGALIAERAPRT